MIIYDAELHTFLLRCGVAQSRIIAKSRISLIHERGNAALPESCGSAGSCGSVQLCGSVGILQLFYNLCPIYLK